MSVISMEHLGVHYDTFRFTSSTIVCFHFVPLLSLPIIFSVLDVICGHVYCFKNIHSSFGIFYSYLLLSPSIYLLILIIIICNHFF